MVSDNLLKLETWIDASHTVHNKIRWHIGGCMSCVVGIIQLNTSKLKLNTQITTQLEVVAFTKCVPYKIHMLNIFLGKRCNLQKISFFKIMIVQ